MGFVERGGKGEDGNFGHKRWERDWRREFMTLSFSDFVS